MAPLTPQEELERLLVSASARLTPELRALAEVIVGRLAGGSSVPVTAAEAELAAKLREILVETSLEGARRTLLIADAYGAAEPDALYPTLLPRVPPSEAVSDLIRREPRLARTAESVSRLYNESHAFALARSASEVLTRKVRDVTVASIQAGLPTPSAVEIIRGMGDFTRGYAETVFRTNANTAYTAGMFKQVRDPDVAQVIGGLRYDAVLDSDVRPNHAAAHGLVASPDDPVWHRIAPPLGYNCFGAGSPVATENGWRRIEDVRVGDLVLTHAGRFMPVERTYARSYSGSMVRLVTPGSQNVGGIMVTAGHRILSDDGAWIPAFEYAAGGRLASVEALGPPDAALPFAEHPYPTTPSARAYLHAMERKGVLAERWQGVDILEADHAEVERTVVFNLRVAVDSSYAVCDFIASNCRCSLGFVPWDDLAAHGLVQGGRVKPASLPSGAHADPGFHHVYVPGIVA